MPQEQPEHILSPSNPTQSLKRSCSQQIKKIYRVKSIIIYHVYTVIWKEVPIQITGQHKPYSKFQSSQMSYNDYYLHSISW